jgi:hypothetical protein
MNIQTLTLILKTEVPVKESPEKLRGYIGNKFKNNNILHHHREDGKNIYKYPRVQYKIIDGTPVILGIEEGVTAIKEIYEFLVELKLGNTFYQIEEKRMIEKKQKFGYAESFQYYRILSPWVALNETNYRTYLQSSSKEKVRLLHRIFAGNLLSISKSFDYIVIDQIKVKTKLSPTTISFKGIPFTGFEGEFQTNFYLPEYFGLGKSVSRGFGTIRSVTNL